MSKVCHNLGFEQLFLAIKFAGCAYLLYMARNIWNAPVAESEVTASRTRVAPLTSFLSSISLALGNPKVIVFFLSIMPLVVDVKNLNFTTYLELASVIVLVFAPLQFGILVLAKQARAVFRSEAALRRINRTTAGIMAGTALAIRNPSMTGFYKVSRCQIPANHSYPLSAQ